MWDLIVSVPDHCLSFYFSCVRTAKALAIQFEDKQNANEQ